LVWSQIVSSGINRPGVADTNKIPDLFKCGKLKELKYKLIDDQILQFYLEEFIRTNLHFYQTIGIHSNGNNGEIHMENNDSIDLPIGILIDNNGGTCCNRQIFIICI
jgi:hypothetical protein